MNFMIWFVGRMVPVHSIEFIVAFVCRVQNEFLLETKKALKNSISDQQSCTITTTSIF